MDSYEIRVLPEVSAMIEQLPDVLVKGGYKSTYENALSIKEDIKQFLGQLPQVPHYPILHEHSSHFNRYNSPSHYAFFRRKQSPSTTWYVFFSIYGRRIVVKHIGNNWSEGQYIR